MILEACEAPVGTWPLEGTETSLLQYQEVFRVVNPSAPGGDGKLIRDVLVRQYLPVTDRVQLLDWYILSDLDPRIVDVEVREWDSAGATNRYVQWRISEIAPGECVQLGYVAGLRSRANVDGSGGQVFRARSLELPDWSPTSPQLNLSSLCQFLPTSPAWTDGWAGLVPAGLSAPGTEWDLWIGFGGVLDRSWSFSLQSTWDEIDLLLQAYFANTSLWYARSRATRIAALVCAVVSSQVYGKTDPHESEGSDERLTHPGSPFWPLLLRDALWVLEDLVASIEGGVLGASGTIAALVQRAAVLFETLGTPACRCSTRSMQALWLLRLAGLPCRELGGQRLQGDPAALSGTGLPAGAHIGHRIVEIWDPECDDWFCMESTSPEVGQDITPLAFLTKVRGCTSPAAPLSWGYTTRIVAAEWWSEDGAALWQRANHLRDGSPESTRTADYLVAGDYWRVNRDTLETQEGRLDDWLNTEEVRFGLGGARMQAAEAADVKQRMVSAMDATEQASGGDRWFPLDVLAGAPVPQPENRVGSPPSLASPFAALVIALAGPQFAVDVDLWFARSYLLLPDPKLPSAQSGLATIERLTSTNSTVSPVGGFGSHPRLGPRGRWAWNFLGNLLYFVGSMAPADDSGGYPRFDCPRRGAEGVSAVHPLELAELYGPPLPVDLVDEGSQPPCLAGAQWVLKIVKLADYIAALGRHPIRTLDYLIPGAIDPPTEDDDVHDWVRASERLTINPWGDLATTPRTISEE